MKKRTLLLILTILIGLHAMAQREAATITCIGQSEVGMTPENVTVSVPISTTNVDYGECYNQLVKQTETLRNDLQKAGVNTQLITTDNLNVRKEYQYEDGKQVYKGYMGSISMQIKGTYSSGYLNSILKVLSSHQSLYSVSFELSDQQNNDLRLKAIDGAMNDAMTNAQQLAKSANVSLGRIVKIDYGTENEVMNYPMYQSLKMSSSNAAANSLELTPEPIIIRKKVMVSYRLGDDR